MTTRPSSTPKRRGRRCGRRGVALLAALAHRPARTAGARPGAGRRARGRARPGATPAPAQSDDPAALVARIALYPDDLVAIILPASTNPLQIVQAERFLAKRKTDPKAPIDEKWDDSVKSLVNYPEVITMMSGDLDWTAALGEAVVADQGAVLEADPGLPAQDPGGRQPEVGPEADGGGREGSDHDRADRSAGDLRAAVQPDHGGGERLCRLGLLPVALSGVLLPLPARRRLRHRADLGRGDGRDLGRRALRLELRRRRHQHQPQHQHQHRRHQHRQPRQPRRPRTRPAARSGARASRRAR